MSLVAVATTNTASKIRTIHRLGPIVNQNTNWNAIARSNNYICSSQNCGFASAVRHLQKGRIANQSAKTKMGPKMRKRSKLSSGASPKNQHARKQQRLQQRQKATLASGSRQQKTEEIIEKTLRERINIWLNQPRRIPVPRWISPELVTFRFSECFGHLSFIFVAISYAVDDFLELRLMAIAGSSAMLVFTYFHPHGRILWLPFRWNFVFVALNSWRVAKVGLDHYRSGQLNPKVDALYENHFGDTIAKTDFARVVQLATLESYEPGETVVAQECENRYVRLVVAGDLAVDRDGQTTYWLRVGQFVSEMGMHAGLGLRGRVTSCCTVKAVESPGGVHLLRWDRTELMHFLELHKSTYRALQACLSWDIVSKLKSQRVLLSSGHIEDPEHWTLKRREQSLARYSAILRNMLAHPGYLNERKEKLSKYREIHQVGDIDHETALKSIGWTLAEFESGYKEGQVDEDELELEKLGWQWWLSSWWKAL